MGRFTLIGTSALTIYDPSRKLVVGRDHEDAITSCDGGHSVEECG